MTERVSLDPAGLTGYTVTARKETNTEKGVNVELISHEIDQSGDQYLFTRVVQPLECGPPTRTTTSAWGYLHRHEANGQVRQITGLDNRGVPTGYSGSVPESYSFDSAGRVTSVTQGGEMISNIQHRRGSLTGITHTTGQAIELAELEPYQFDDHPAT